MTKSAILDAFFTSYPEGDKKVNIILWSLYFSLRHLKTGSPCSYSPKDEQCTQMTLSFSLIKDWILLKDSFLPINPSLIFLLNLDKILIEISVMLTNKL